MEGHFLSKTEVLDCRVLTGPDTDPPADQPLKRSEFGGQFHLTLAFEQLVDHVDRKPAGSQNRSNEKTGVDDLKHVESLPVGGSIAESPSTDSVEGGIVNRCLGMPETGHDPCLGSFRCASPLQRVGMFEGEVAILIPVHDE